MSPPVDPAILEALGLDPSTTEAKIASHGGSGFASSYKLAVTTPDGEEKPYFVKTGSGKDAEVMFQGEHTSLNAIHAAVPSFCPQSHGHGALSASPGRYFLVTDFLDLSGYSTSSSSDKGTNLSLATKLAKLHTTPAPSHQFGFPVSTCCGSTVQDNSFKDSWADFYANNRLRHILQAGIKRNGNDAELSELVEKTASRVVPRLIGEETIGKVTPVVIHGDLWSGNHGRGRNVTKGGAQEEVVFDPSSVYGHSEYELGIMKMFGGFGGAFWKEYEKVVPKGEPVGEWEDRVRLYELYHHLNHFALFGGGYRSGAVSIMKKLIAKYG